MYCAFSDRLAQDQESVAGLFIPRVALEVIATVPMLDGSRDEGTHTARNISHADESWHSLYDTEQRRRTICQSL